jgi:DNA-binding CsgD family transcriptional regulator
MMVILFLLFPISSNTDNVSCALFEKSLFLGIVFSMLRMMTLYFFNGFCWGIGRKVIPIIYKYVFISTMILSCAFFILYWSSPQNLRNMNNGITALSTILDVFSIYFMIAPILYLLGITNRQLDCGVKKLVKYIALYYISFILFFAAILFRFAETDYLCSYLFIINSLPVAGIYYLFKNDLDHNNDNDYLASFKVSHTRDISRREYEIVGKMLDGKSNNQIAAELFLSVRTVDTHIYNIYKKLGINNRFQLFKVFQNELHDHGLNDVSVENS